MTDILDASVAAHRSKEEPVSVVRWRSMQRRLGLSLALALASPVAAAAAPADVYHAWKAAHPDPAAEIADLKAKTAALVAAAKASQVLGPAIDRPSVVHAVPGAITSIIDCAGICPEMVVVPAGEFTMGTAQGDAGHKPDEGPPRRVTIDQPVAVGRFAVTVAAYETFTADTGRAVVSGCNTADSNGKRGRNPRANWRDPGFKQGPDEPVVCVSWDDAKAYAAWLSAKTGHGYRLLSEAEWEYAARAGTRSRFQWGDDEADACAHANVADATLKARFPDWSAFSCSDGFHFTAPVGRFPPNAFGLHDMAGNVWSWTEDCYADYAEAPLDGSASLAGQCAKRVLRGGSWGNDQVRLRAADRDAHAPDARGSGGGIRVARSL
ncbi:formylglycine-generating enzyme family protein [Shinella sp. BYT-45]|uniref:formylglycine-generating enzyme family protein n=1 Tax=Shinella sp. BYT-45 TaxID=3377377 RepID=UPI00397F7786